MINKGAAATALYAFKKRDFIKGKQVLLKEDGSQTSHPYRKIITDRSTSLRKDKQGQREVSLPLRHVCLCENMNSRLPFIFYYLL